MPHEEEVPAPPEPTPKESSQPQEEACCQADDGKKLEKRLTAIEDRLDAIEGRM